jgi:hypothetical protein
MFVFSTTAAAINDGSGPADAAARTATSLAKHADFLRERIPAVPFRYRALYQELIAPEDSSQTISEKLLPPFCCCSNAYETAFLGHLLR